MVHDPWGRKSGRFTRFPAAAVLTIWLAVTAIASPAAGETLRISGTGGALGAVRLLAEEFGKHHPDVAIVFLPSVGSSGAIKAVLAGALDVGVTSRALRAEEERQGAVQYRYAITPLVFATGLRTRASGFTSGQLAEIYAGVVGTWPDGRPIRLILRPEANSDTLTLRHISQDMHQALDRAFSRKGMSIALTDRESADMIENVPGALGTISLTQILTEKRAVRPLSVNGVAPTTNALKDGSYAHFKTLYLVTRANASGHSRRFVDFSRSRQVRPILTKTGHVVPGKTAVE